MTNPSIQQDYPSSNQKDSEEISNHSIKKDRNVWGRESWFQDLNYIEFKLMSLISALSQNDGRSFMKDETFAKRFDCGVSTIERALKNLDEKKYIFRNTYSNYVHGKLLGKKRIIVSKYNALDYWNNYLNKYASIPIEVKYRFLKHFDLPNPYSQVIENEGSKRPRKDEGYSRPRKGEGCSLLRKGVAEGSEQEPEEPPDPVVVSSASERDGLLKELDQTKHSKEDKAYAMQYFDVNRDAVMKASSPVGYLVWAITSGIAKQVIDAREEKAKELIDDSKQKDELERVAEEFKEEFKETYWKNKITISPVNIVVHYSSPSNVNGEIFTVPASKSVDLKQKGYEKSLKSLKDWMYECLELVNA